MENKFTITIRAPQSICFNKLRVQTVYLTSLVTRDSSKSTHAKIGSAKGEQEKIHCRCRKTKDQQSVLMARQKLVSTLSEILAFYTIVQLP